MADVALEAYRIVDGLNDPELGYVCKGGACCSCGGWMDEGAPHIHIRQDGTHNGVCSEACAISFVTTPEESSNA